MVKEFAISFQGEDDVVGCIEARRYICRSTIQQGERMLSICVWQNAKTFVHETVGYISRERRCKTAMHETFNANSPIRCADAIITGPSRP